MSNELSAQFSKIMIDSNESPIDSYESPKVSNESPKVSNEVSNESNDTNDTKESEAPFRYETTLLFHGNCIDGWFSAYFAYCALAGNGPVQMYAISPSQPNTWPESQLMEGTAIWLLDVSVSQDYREGWLKCGARSVNCIDHHATAKEHWPHDCPIDTDSCAAIQTHRHFFPDRPIPEWLHSVDRVDRWTNVTHEDRCLREYFHEIAHLPVQRKINEAIERTNAFLYNLDHTENAMKRYVEDGAKALILKDTYLHEILKKGTILIATTKRMEEWKLPASWHGKKMFIMDNTDYTIDTTEASHLTFQKDKTIDVFVNYRRKVFYANKVRKTMIVYSARSQTMNLTDDTIFHGHPTAAGASLVHGEAQHFPFLLKAQPARRPRIVNPVPTPVIPFVEPIKH